MGSPLGSKNKVRTDSAPTVVQDSYLEAFAGTGTNRDRNAYVRIASATLLDEMTLSDMYVADGFARRVVDLPAEEMTRSGIEIEDLDDDDLKKLIDSKMDELDAFRHFNDAIRWSRLHGGSILIYGLNDGGTLDVPLNPQGIKSVEFLRVYDRWQATIQTRVTDPQSMDYGKPEMWLISPKTGGNPYQVHNSRVHVFDGDSIPDRSRQSNLGWGASALQACHSQLKRLSTAHQYTNAILERSQQAVQKIPRMSEMMRAPGGIKNMQQRVDVVDMVRGAQNTIIIDGEEDYVVQSTAMAGYPDVLDRFAEAVCAIKGIPVPVFMGRASGGLSNTDKGVLDTWYAQVASMWNDQLRKPEDRLISYIMMALNGDVPEYKLCMRSLGVMSEKEEAEIEKLKAETRKIDSEADEIYANISVIDQIEIRAKRSEYYDIDPKSAPPEPPEPEVTDGL